VVVLTICLLGCGSPQPVQKSSVPAPAPASPTINPSSDPSDPPAGTSSSSPSAPGPNLTGSWQFSVEEYDAFQLALIPASSCPTGASCYVAAAPAPWNQATFCDSGEVETFALQEVGDKLTFVIDASCGQGLSGNGVTNCYGSIDTSIMLLSGWCDFDNVLDNVSAEIPQTVTQPTWP
jgi:hypothetical protein